MEEGRKVYEFRKTDLRPLLFEVLEHYRRQTEHDGFRIKAVIVDDLPLLRVDGDALTQAISNLLDNAVKYSLLPLIR